MARKHAEQKAKPTNDAYTGMLAISFVALLVGCALLYMDYDQYQAKPPAKLNPNDPAFKERPAPDVVEGKKTEKTDTKTDVDTEKTDKTDTEKDKTDTKTEKAPAGG
jgi:hypothetical protein